MNPSKTFNRSIGLNKTVVTLAIARMGDAAAGSIVLIVLPLLLVHEPGGAGGLPASVRLGMLLSVFGFITACLQPLMAGLCDRAGRYKRFLQGGMALIAVPMLLFTVAEAYPALLLLRMLQGVGLALVIPAAMASMAAATEKQTRGGAMGFYITLRILGFILGSVLAGFLHDRIGVSAPLYAGAALLLFSVVLLQFGFSAAAAGDACPRCSPLLDRSLFNRKALSATAAVFLVGSGFTMVTTLEKEFRQMSIVTMGFGFGPLAAGVLSARSFQLPFWAMGLLCVAGAAYVHFNMSETV